ncbi:4'-phosphopantetheinyl transferase family protein [Psychroserpens sp. Hel_I_66]|uniref:4'-phosphopantetheinyl transferase family protein n=1 Tax=Psychroserpens sp. Hel_I_66 TaxID=1250004 RepID=UPI00064849BC|nr:4'-phosphopantetheinyl transferase superfamily protein [Psychroserpens sp. Hel_I_66]
MSEIFCGNIEIIIKDFQTLPEDKLDLKLFKIQLSSYVHLVSELTSVLNLEELKRANSFHFEKDKNRFIICRSILKFLLSKFTKISLSQIEIRKDTNNKPYIISYEVIHFNVSHSEDFVIIAIDKQPIGVDLEFLNKSFDFSEILPSVFNKIEIDNILNSENKPHTFFTYWTRKEAVVKATGKGMTDHVIQIPALDGLHSVNPKLIEGFEDLNVLSFDINKDYVGSIASSKDLTKNSQIQVYDLPKTIEALK